MLRKAIPAAIAKIKMASSSELILVETVAVVVADWGTELPVVVVFWLYPITHL